MTLLKTAGDTFIIAVMSVLFKAFTKGIKLPTHCQLFKVDLKHIYLIRLLPIRILKDSGMDCCTVPHAGL